VSKAEEQRLVQKFITHPAVKTLAEAVLNRLARCDVMPLHADLPAPCQRRIAGQFGPVIADDHPGLPRAAISSASLRRILRPEINVSSTARGTP